MSPNSLKRSPIRAISTAIAAAALSVATAVPATAAPPVMPVGGVWDIVQTNGFRVTVNLTVYDGDKISGTARTAGMSSNNVTGWVNNHAIHLEMPWTPGDSVGIYDGQLTPNKFSLPGNYLTGRTCDKTHPTSCADWSSEGIVL